MTNCLTCAHYHVTWDKFFPHGCRGFGFKSRGLPCLKVRRCSGGLRCQLYLPKSRRKTTRRIP